MRSNRSFLGNVFKRLVVLSAMVAMTTSSNAAGLGNIQKIEPAHEEQSAATPHPDADRSLRTGAAVTPVSRVSDLHDHALSAFIIDYAPGGSAMLHRSPSSGYVLVHVLSGTIKAYAWQAGVGIYHAAETRTEPAVVIATGDEESRDIATNDPR